MKATMLPDGIRVGEFRSDSEILDAFKYAIAARFKNVTFKRTSEDVTLDCHFPEQEAGHPDSVMGVALCLVSAVNGISTDETEERQGAVRDQFRRNLAALDA